MQRSSTKHTVRARHPVGAVRLQAPASTPAKPLDFLFIGGGPDADRLTASWRRSATRGNLHSKRLLTDDMEGRNSAQKLEALMKEVRQMRRQGLINDGTQIVVDFHGADSVDNKVFLTSESEGCSGFTVKAETFMLKLRQALADPADPDQQASKNLVHLNCCHAGRLRRLLANGAGGPTFLYAGKKASLLDDGLNTIKQVIKAWSRTKRSSHALSEAELEFIWSTATAHTGENIAWVGHRKIRKHNALKSASEAESDNPISPSRRGRVLAAKLEHGSLKSVQQLLGKNPRDAYRQCQFGVDGPMELAASSARERGQKINYLVECLEHDVNQTDPKNSTTLHVIAQYESAGALRTLIHQGADVLLADLDHYLPLHRAATSTTDCCEKIEFLLCADPQRQVDRPGPGGRSALHLAVMESNVEAATTLLLCGADPNFQDEAGNTAFDLLEALADGAIKDELRLKMELLESRVNQLDEKGRSALHVKAVKGSADEIQALLGRKACPFKRDLQGTLPIHAVAAGSRTDTLAKFKALSASGPRVDETDLHGNTALGFAAAAGNVEAVRALLELGADPGLPNQYGILPIHCAQKNVVDLLLKAMASRDEDPAPLPDLSLLINRLAASGDSIERLQQLMKLPGALERRDSMGVTALAAAALAGKLEVARLLLEAGAAPNVRFDNGSTLLAQLRALKLRDMVALLLEFKADPDW